MLENPMIRIKNSDHDHAFASRLLQVVVTAPDMRREAMDIVEIELAH